MNPTAEIFIEEYEGVEKICILIEGNPTAAFGIHDGKISVNYHHRLFELKEMGYTLRFVNCPS